MTHTRLKFVGGPADGATIERPNSSTVIVPMLIPGRPGIGQCTTRSDAAATRASLAARSQRRPGAGVSGAAGSVRGMDKELPWNLSNGISSVLPSPLFWQHSFSMG